MKQRLSHGLTLIEMLVVLLIMGLLVSVTALSTGLAGRSDSEDAARTAEDLSRLFEHAAQQALARGDVLGWSLDAADSRTMRWWLWSSDTGVSTVVNTSINTTTINSAISPGNGVDSQGAAARWQSQPHSFLPSVELPAQLALQLSALNPGARPSQQPATGPQLVFLPGLETVPFELRLLDEETGQALARIWSDQPGRVDWSVL
jgi:prepilin-type N-terminal cleavage/methylation domain-containing protein